MTEKLEIYKCNVCGNTVQVLFSGEGKLVCCGEEMELLHPQQDTESEIGEKHTPILETDINGRFIRIKNHPMTDEHNIQFLEAISEDKLTMHVKFLRPKDIAEFDITAFEQEIDAFGLCNIHGLWRN